MKILETPRLLLRTIRPKDARFYLELVNDTAFVEHIGDRGIRSVDDARDAIEKGPMAMQAKLGHSIYLVALKDTGVAIGMCGLIKRETLTDVDIGYAFLPPYRGQGYAYEAAVGVLEHARSRLRIRRLVAIASPDNAGSIRLLTRLGLRFEELVHLTPDDPGTNLYSIQLSR